MKKNLLLALGVIFAFCSINAQYVSTPKSYSNKFIKGMSPDGKFAASGDEYTGEIAVYNLSNNTKKSYKTQDEESEFYEMGFGANMVSNTGIVLISTTYDGSAAYIENGKVNFLPLPDGVNSALCTSITPDGSRIAGSVGIKMTMDTNDVMQRPVIWNRQNDGTYSAPVELPYPTKDFTDRTPQYVLVDGITADGKTLACNVRDYLGEMCQPMILQENEMGEWTYTMLANEYINPDKLELPKYPGESPYPGNYMTPAEANAYNQAVTNAALLTQPLPNEFMSPEKRAEYEAATSGYGNPVNFMDYMSDEEYAAYLAALEQYYKDLYPKPEDYMYPEHREAYLYDKAEWNSKYDEFMRVFQQIQESSVEFGMNELVISQNGKYYAIAGSTTDPETKQSLMKVYIFDLETGESFVKGLDGVNILIPRYVTNDGRVLASSVATMRDKTSNTYFSSGMNSPFMPLKDIAKENNSTLYNYMEKNMLHEMWVWDDDIEDDVKEQIWVTGVGCCDSEMNTIITWTTTDTWDSSNFNTTYAYSYLMPTSFLKEYSTIIQHVSSNAATAVDDMVRIYDLNGRLVFSANNQKEAGRACLPSGVYVVKTANGVKRIVL